MTASMFMLSQELGRQCGLMREALEKIAKVGREEAESDPANTVMWVAEIAQGALKEVDDG